MNYNALREALRSFLHKNNNKSVLCSAFLGKDANYLIVYVV